jgi:hypothetical protein
LARWDDADFETLRLLYSVLRDKGRIAEAYDLLNRMVDLEPSAATATFAYRERSKLGEASSRPVRIALLSSCVLDPVIPFLGPARTPGQAGGRCQVK